MKSIVIASVLLLTGGMLLAQTPIDQLQQNNREYLKEMESEGFQFRSQIITEFNPENAEQLVKIKLKAGATYQLVALGDADIENVTLGVKSFKKYATTSETGEAPTANSDVMALVPEKSGTFKITIAVKDFSSTGQGFVSFMVLRK